MQVPKKYSYLYLLVDKYVPALSVISTAPGKYKCLYTRQQKCRVCNFLFAYLFWLSCFLQFHSLLINISHGNKLEMYHLLTSVTQHYHLPITNRLLMLSSPSTLKASISKRYTPGAVPSTESIVSLVWFKYTLPLLYYEISCILTLVVLRMEGRLMRKNWFMHTCRITIGCIRTDLPSMRER